MQSGAGRFTGHRPDDRTSRGLFDVVRRRTPSSRHEGGAEVRGAVTARTASARRSVKSASLSRQARAPAVRTAAHDADSLDTAITARPRRTSRLQRPAGPAIAEPGGRRRPLREENRLAGAVRCEEAGDRAGSDGGADAVDGGLVAAALGEAMCLDHDDASLDVLQVDELTAAYAVSCARAWAVVRLSADSAPRPRPASALVIAVATRAGCVS